MSASRLPNSRSNLAAALPADADPGDVIDRIPGDGKHVADLGWRDVPFGGHFFFA